MMAKMVFDKNDGKGGGYVKRLDTSYFSSAIHTLSTAVKDFNDALRDVQRSTENVKACWEGKGAKKFDKAYWRLKREFDDQAETLTALRDDLQVVLETYEAWDEELKNNIAGNSVK